MTISFGKDLLILLTAHSLCNILVILVISHFGFKGMLLLLTAPFPGHCLPFTFPA